MVRRSVLLLRVREMCRALVVLQSRSLQAVRQLAGESNEFNAVGVRPVVKRFGQHGCALFACLANHTLAGASNGEQRCASVGRIGPSCHMTVVFERSEVSADRR